MERRQFIGYSIAGLGMAAVAANGKNLQYVAKSSDKKWAVLFGTWYGTARDAGMWISEGMGGIAQVYDVRQNPDLSGCEHLVVGAAIHGGRGPKELDAYLKKHLSHLKEKIRGLYIVCGAMGQQPGPDQVKEYIDGYLANVCGTDKAMKKAFGGRITKRLLSTEDNQNLEAFHKEINKPYIDYDNLNRSDCLAFGQHIFDATK
ncbi:MAG: flavodoxin domain-containing protein [bacterium]